MVVYSLNTAEYDKCVTYIEEETRVEINQLLSVSQLLTAADRCKKMFTRLATRSFCSAAVEYWRSSKVENIRSLKKMCGLNIQMGENDSTATRLGKGCHYTLPTCPAWHA